MKGVAMDESKAKLLLEQVTNPPFSAGGATMGLLQGISAVNRADSTATVLAFESTFSGYARQTLANPTTPLLTGGVARTNFDLVVFTNLTGVPQTIDGFFYFDTSAGVLLLAGLYDTPVVIAPGDTFPTRPFWSRNGRFDDSP